ncbi:hypothetical protein [Nesterenkonia sp. NBAIMH1]|uniref:hypothetical protein n=1 Tax=Nesterenkonia sp. NBAIMH1 TaxID=2600320 RepID=UPI00143E02CB|nr:hypothetical protein [Nesterenkonia sp. NBAIMH1]
MSFPVLTLLAEEHSEALFMPAPWFGILMFAFLMLAMLVALSFAQKNRSPQADPEAGGH